MSGLLTGLALSEGFYREYGEPMLKKQFPELFPRTAAAFLGNGSEVLGYDDEVSRDHDFEPGFCLFLPGEDVISRREAFLLERAYADLPKTYRGVERQKLNPVGGARHGVMRLAAFLKKTIGREEPALTIQEWLTVPEQAFLEVTAGKVFSDESGFLTRVREDLYYLPEDIAVKKLAGNLLYAAQSGTYNYRRCLEHGEEAAAQLALFSFTEAAMHCCFILSEKYMPYFKWRFRAFDGLEAFRDLKQAFEGLILLDNGQKNRDLKEEKIGLILKRILKASGFPEETDAGKAAYELNDSIRDHEIRELNILAAVS